MNISIIILLKRAKSFVRKQLTKENLEKMVFILFIVWIYAGWFADIMAADQMIAPQGWTFCGLLEKFMNVYETYIHPYL